MDRHALALQLFGKSRDQGEVVGRTRTYFGTALADSANGRVMVSTDGVMVTEQGAEGIEIDCSTSVKAGERVKITVVNGAPVDSVAIGWGDAVSADLAAQSAYFAQLFAQNVTAEQINASAVFARDVSAGTVSAEAVEAIRGAFERVDASQLSADDIEAASAAIEQLEAGAVTAAQVQAMRALFERLCADEVEAVSAAFDEVEAGTLSAAAIKAGVADVGTLKTTKLDADFGNFSAAQAQLAKIRDLFAASGWFESVTMAGGTVTGKLTAVLIDGDEAAITNVRADSLTLLGDDGLYYALNVNALGQATASQLPAAEQQALRSGLHGSNIIAGTITADKVTVTDLAAFGALIAGMQMSGGSIHTVGKSSLGSAVPGFYLDSAGNLQIGDSDSYLTFYRGLDDEWHLDISAESLTFGGSTPVTQLQFADAIVRDGFEYAANYSRASAPTGGWSGTPPALSDGMCLWRRSVTQRADGTVQTGPAECVTGNQGDRGEDAVTVCLTSDNGTVFKRNAGVSTTFTATVYHGGSRITDAAGLASEFGAGAYLEWSWRDRGEAASHVLLSSDARISQGGFRLTVSPGDIDTQAVIACSLNA